MNTVPAYVWVSRDPACRHMISNQYGYDFLNMHPGSNVSMSAPPEEFPQHHQVLRQNQPIPADEMPMQVAARTGLPQMDQEFDVVFEDGKTFHLYGNATPLLDADDQPAGAVGVFMDITELKQAETEATRLAAENEIKQRLIGQREQERLQIARDLHDGPVQELLGAIFAMQSLEVDNQDPDLKDRSESVKKILETQVKDLREYAQELRPPTLSKFGLAKALLSHAEQFEEKHPNLRLALDVYQDGVTLPEQVRTALFRVYQEALNNIIRHARAKRVTVRFNRDAQGVRLLIEDDGQGLTLPENWIDLARDGHLGLVGMRERIEAVGGALHVSSQPGRGTRVRVTVPV
ncbi:MAG TPA: ATP-binding protein, partial [Anaerolineaceae bacterium]